MQLPVFSPFVLVALVVFACCLISAGIGILLTRAKFKKIKFIKTRIIICLSLVGIITLYFAFYTVSNMIGRNSVKEMWGKVEAGGIVTNVAQIIPTPPKDPSENAVSLYKASIALLENADIQNKRFEFNRKYKNSNDLSNWTSKDRIAGLKLSKEKNIQLALSLFSQGAKKAYAINNRKYEGIKTLLPQLRGYRKIFRTISFAANCYAYENRLDEAYDLTIDGLNFIHQFRNDPSFIGQLVYIACTWIDLHTVRGLVSRYAISSKKARKIIEAMDKIDYNQSMKKGITGELVLSGRDFYENVMAGNRIYAYFLSGPRNKGLADIIYIYPFIYQDYARYVKFGLKTYESFDKPFWQVDPKLKNSKKARRLLLPVGRYILGSLPYARTKVARMNSITAATKVILALHIYKNKHGKFPEKLDALVPEILKEITVDAVSGKAYSYKKEGKYFKLTGFYSGNK
ncbi:MAG: hypothetical protein KAS17_07210 [Victivallaceae bacterium]|nr:hypothetical protein [Victivallaceae bacterium]